MSVEVCSDVLFMSQGRVCGVAAKVLRCVGNCGQIKEELQLHYALKEGSLQKRESSAAVSLMVILVVCECLFMNLLCLAASDAILLAISVLEAFCAHFQLTQPA